MKRMKETDAERLKQEYHKLVEGLRDLNESRLSDQVMGNPGFFK